MESDDEKEDEINDVRVSVKEEVKRDKVYLVPLSVNPSQFREIGARVLDALILISANVEKVEIIKVKNMSAIELVEYLKEKGVKFS